MSAPDVDAHTHLYAGLSPLGGPTPPGAPAGLLEVLRRHWWRMDRALDHATLRAAARLRVARALAAGTGALVDHLEAPACIEGSLDVLADACQSLGCRALLCYGATERNGGRDEARRGLAECARFLRDNRRPLVRGAVGLHAGFTVSDDTVREAAALARAHGAPLHLHVAEGGCDVDDARARGYAGPVARLEALGALGPGDVLAHAVWITDAEAARVEALGAWVAQCPRSNAGNRVGYPARLRGVSRVALGTDGFPAGMADEAAALAREARAHGDDEGDLARRVAGGRRLAEALFGPTDDRLARDGDRVRELVVGGRAVVRDGALLTADVDTLDAEARDAAGRLWRAMRGIP